MLNSKKKETGKRCSGGYTLVSLGEVVKLVVGIEILKQKLVVEVVILVIGGGKTSSGTSSITT